MSMARYDIPGGPDHATRPRAPHGRARRPRRAAPTGTSTGTPTGTRAAEDVGPYQMDYISESFFRSA